MNANIARAELRRYVLETDCPLDPFQVDHLMSQLVLAVRRDNEPIHDHRWQPVGIISWGAFGKGVAQSCECGEVRGVGLTET